MTIFETSPEWHAACRPIEEAEIAKALAELVTEAGLALDEMTKAQAAKTIKSARNIGSGRAVQKLHKMEVVGGVRNPAWNDPEWGYPASKAKAKAVESKAVEMIGMKQSEADALAAWLAEQTWSDFAQSLAAQFKKNGGRISGLSQRQWDSAKKMKATMDAKAAAKAEAAKVTPIIPSKTTGLDLTDLPSGYYAVPGGDTRLKVRVARPTKASRWHGWIFVSDGAEYGQRKNYGKQAPSGMYQGEIGEQLAAIIADPYEAMVAYGKLTGTCGACGRLLEDQDSIQRGIGPVCAGKFAA